MTMSMRCVALRTFQPVLEDKVGLALLRTASWACPASRWHPNRGEAMTKIERLSEAVVRRLRSAVTAPTLSRIVLELLQNALDAKATAVELCLNIPDGGFCRLSDNGHGITPADFDLVAERYATSKAGGESSSHSFGFRGEALASVTDIAVVEITSRCPNRVETYHKIIKYGKTIYSGPAAEPRSNSGTTVVLRDVFGNYPIRQALLKKTETVDSIRRAVEPTLFIACGLDFEIIDRSSGKRALVLKKQRSIQACFSHLAGINAAELRPFRVTVDGYRAEGFVGNSGYPTKQHQYLYVNRHIITNHDMHKFINSLLEEQLQSTHSYGAKRRNLYSIWLLDLSCPADTCDLLLDPAKEIVEFTDVFAVQETICTAIQAATKAWSASKPYRALPTNPTPYQLSPRTGHDISNPVAAGTRSRVYQQTVPSFSAIRRGVLDSKSDARLDFSLATRSSLVPQFIASLTSDGRPNTALEEIDAASASPRIQADRSLALSTQSAAPSCNEPGAYFVNSQYHFPTDQALRKDDIAMFKVLSQVDSKFIACVVHRRNNTGSTIVIIDQHAADERIRLERLLSELDWPDLGLLGPHAPPDTTDKLAGLPSLPLTEIPCTFIIDEALEPVFRRHQQHARRWGFVYQVRTARSQFDSRPDYAVVLSHIPRVISDRCLGTSGLIEALLVQIVHGFDAEPSSTHTCPRSLMEVLNSKACRSAIMFGDRLSTSRCVEMVERLKMCKFPFQCAHGRPSMIPVAQIPNRPLVQDKKYQIKRLSMRTWRPDASRFTPNAAQDGTAQAMRPSSS
ncbi:uncharacterized protein BJ171DRAFT_499175 [Polychytrium aggregatum]|uniref:uncharacterized protein n=1 Tax=Polychytrium aggregatum TaxID=110093 RepID=UPI0022FDB944|nr:uncharacterized protein BJ171DRAFT_499175 [Polychytrium aggregatum]KAI9206235.1 hypothetical protein BJ171DRAFT_499175 [Polychytrium aggregatum]